MEYPDPSKWVAMLESLFGARAGRAVATALAALGCLALALWLASIILTYGGKTTVEFFGTLLHEDIPLDNLTAALATLVWAIILFGIIVVAFLYFFARTLFKRAISQSSLDGIAELRAHGVNTILTFRPTNDTEFAKWMELYEKWESDVKSYLANNFPAADQSSFNNLGIVEVRQLDSSFIYNLEHNRKLIFLAKQITILETLLDGYRRN